MPWHDVVVVGVQVGFVVEDEDTWLGVAAGQVRGSVQVEEFGRNRVAIGRAERSFYNQYPVWARPIESELLF